MLGMIAALRGAVHNLINGDPEDEVATHLDAKLLLEETASDADDSDLVDGGFDMSWSPRHQFRTDIEKLEQ